MRVPVVVAPLIEIEPELEMSAAADEETAQQLQDTEQAMQEWTEAAKLEPEELEELDVEF